MKNKKFVRVVDIKFNDRFYFEQDIKTMAKHFLDVTKPKNISIGDVVIDINDNKQQLKKG